MAIARDGTGALLFLQNVGGTRRLFASVLTGGVFAPPQQIDAALPGPSSQPVVAATNNGLVVIAFISGGDLWAVVKGSSGAPFGAPQRLFAGAANPAIGISTLGKAYVAFTAQTPGGGDVRAAYYNRGSWGVEGPPLDDQAADDAGNGTGRPAVGVSGDGVAIVAWGEAGHVFTRRVWATSPSISDQRADPPALGTQTEVSADEPQVGTGGDSSYADVAVHAVVSDGTNQQSRVVVSHLRGGSYDSATAADGLTGPGEGGADHPALALSEYARGFITAARSDGSLWAAHATTNGVIDGTLRVDSLGSSTPPVAVPGLAGLTSNLIAWQRDPGGAGTPEIRLRYAANGVTLGPELVVSDPSLGPTDAASGLAAGGDAWGDAAVAWIQGTPDARRAMVEQLYQPLGPIAAVTPFAYLATDQPRLTWTPARVLWGPVRYTVTVDGVLVGQTTATSLVVPMPLADGRHSWQVTAVNPAGEQSTSRPAAFFTDTVAPIITGLQITGRLRVRSTVHAYVTYTDTPPPEPPSGSSGIASVSIDWGDGSRYLITHGKFHVYRAPGRYTITVRVTDRAGNSATAQQVVRIAALPHRSKPQQHRRAHR